MGMLEQPFTLGHLLMALGLVALLAAVGLGFGAARWRGERHGRGTPGYARARTGRRHALYALVVGVLLFAAGCLTPLGGVALT